MEGRAPELNDVPRTEPQAPLRCAPVAAGGGTRAIVAAGAANLGIAVAKFVGFLLTGSGSLLAEAVHSVADTSNQGLLLLGGARSRRAATAEHAFGFGRERYFWSFVVAIVLFTAGGAFAVYEGIAKIRHPHELESVPIAIAILVVAILLEGYSFRTAWVEVSHVRGQQGIVDYVRHAKAPELPVVLLEDMGALVGLVLALGAVGLVQITGDPMWDGVGTLCIGVLLCLIALVLAVEMKSLLIGESVTSAMAERITGAAAATPGVVGIIHMRTQHLGPDDVLVGIKLEFDPGLDVASLAAAVDAVEAAIRGEVPEVGPIYVEPDLMRRG